MNGQNEFTEVFRVKGVPIRFHWSLMLLLFFIFLTSIVNGRFPMGVIAIGVILVVHELGHMWFATLKGLRSYKIDLYPIGGACFHQPAYNEYDNTFVAWGGVVAQAIIFVPVLLLTNTFGYMMPSELYRLFYYLGEYNLIIALINLIPIAPLDGANAWRWVKLYLDRQRRR